MINDWEEYILREVSTLGHDILNIKIQKWMKEKPLGIPYHEIYFSFSMSIIDYSRISSNYSIFFASCKDDS